MFKLKRYFSFASAAAIILVTVFLSVLYWQNAVSTLTELIEAQNVVLSRSLANTIWPKYADYVKAIPDLDGDALRDRMETENIHTTLKKLTDGLPVLKVKMYSLEGLTVYSSEFSQIGASKKGNTGFESTVRMGTPSTKSSFRETFLSFNGPVTNRHLIESYLPILSTGGVVEGVFEIYADVTPQIAKIKENTITAVLYLLLSLGLLYGVLFLIIRRADRILKHQYIDLEHEVRERKRNEDAFRDSEQKFKDFAGVSSDWFWEMDEHYTISYLSGQNEKITGYSLEDLRGMRREEFTVEDTSTPRWKKHQATLKEKKPFHDFTYDFRHSDGNVIHISISGKPIYDQNGTFKGYRGTGADITDIKRAEIELGNTLRDFSAVMEAIDYGVLFMGPDLRATIINKAFQKIWGIPDDLVSKNPTLAELIYFNRHNGLYDVADQNFDEYVKERVKKVEKGSMPPSNFLRADGKILNYQCITLPNGGRMLTYYDITEIKRLEKTTHKALEEAEKANQSKSNFLAQMSHEIRTPMNGITSVSELLDMSNLTDEQSDMNRIIRESANSLLMIINDILDFSKIEAGKLELVENELSLSSIIKSVGELLSPAATEKGLAFNVEIDSKAPDALIGDQGRLRQIFMNLVGNAIKFTDAGHIGVKSTLVNKSGETVTMEFAVTDTGIGLNDEQIAGLFQPFTQVDTSSVRAHRGTGLGLAICKTLVERMGGSIRVDSTPGKGSAFIFEIPFCTLTRETVATIPDTSGESKKTYELTTYTPPSVEEAMAQGALILVAEDNPTNKTVIRMLMDKLGYATEITDDGEKALKLYDKNTYGLLLTDCNMPVMDGYQLTRKIREREKVTGERMPIVALTADAITDAEQRCLDAGMDHYLSKPVKIKALDETIREWLPKAALLRKLRFDDENGHAPTQLEKSTVSEQDGHSLESISVLDLSYLRTVVGEADELLPPLLEDFISTTAPVIEQLIVALNEKKFDRARKAAHSGAGSAKTVGALKLASICTDVEEALMNDDFDLAAIQTASIEQAFSQVADEINAI